MNKTEALARLDALESEAAKLRATIEAPEAMPPQVGRLCYLSDEYPTCPGSGFMGIVTEYKANERSPFRTEVNGWNYARIATWAELGVPWVEDMERFVERIADGLSRHEALSHYTFEARRILAMREKK